jgi:hypothetical protein
MMIEFEDYSIIGMKRHDTLTRRIRQMRQSAAQKTDVAAAQTASKELLAARAARKERRAEVVEICKGAVA